MNSGLTATARRGRRAIAVLASLTVLVLMWLPVADPLPEITLWYEDKWQHLLVYGALTTLWWWSGVDARMAAVGVAIWSLALESVQAVIPYRGFEVADLAANATGCLLAWMILRRHAHGRVAA